MLRREKTEIAACSAVAVAIDKDKSSHGAFKWALDNVVSKRQTLTLLHVNTKPPPSEDVIANILREVFTPFRCFCTRKDVQSKDVILQDTDVARAIIDFVANAAIEKLVIGCSSSRSGFVRSFRNTDIGGTIYKGLANFCTLYIIYKGKVTSTRNAVRPAPAISLPQTQTQSSPSVKPEHLEHDKKNVRSDNAHSTRSLQKESNEPIKSPFARGLPTSNIRQHEEMFADNDTSFMSTSRQSIERSFPQRMPNISDRYDLSYESPRMSAGTYSTRSGFSSLSHESATSQATEVAEAEIKRLRLELKYTMDMYSTARKEAFTAKQKAMEFQCRKVDEEHRQDQPRMGEVAALTFSEGEKAKSEEQTRISVEMTTSVKEADKNKDFDDLSHINFRYRRYTLEEIEVATNNYAEDKKVGEGGYGPVYKCYLDHTPVAVKVLRPDAEQGRSQFHQEVEILCCIRHPNMVLLLGACPENGCLVYEYMANGSLEDRLFRLGNTPPIPWQHRFRIAAEIGTGLLFLHQTKPEPLVHRDLKPGNILLDRNYVSKISDVGLARLVPPSVAEDVTQYRMTAAAGTFCYIDPEYQQTGMLGTKSDIYSLGIILLQIITSKPPMGLAHYVERAIERGQLAEMLDPLVSDWPLEEALSLAKLALKCAELRRKDRPDLATVILPELNRLRELSDENMKYSIFGNISHTSRMHNPVSTQSGYEKLCSRYNGSYMSGKD